MALLNNKTTMESEFVLSTDLFFFFLTVPRVQGLETDHLG